MTHITRAELRPVRRRTWGLLLNKVQGSVSNDMLWYFPSLSQTNAVFFDVFFLGGGWGGRRLRSEDRKEPPTPWGRPPTAAQRPTTAADGAGGRRRLQSADQRWLPTPASGCRLRSEDRQRWPPTPHKYKACHTMLTSQHTEYTNKY